MGQTKINVTRRVRTLLTKGLVYYTDNQCEDSILKLVQENIKSCGDYKIVSVSLKPIDFGENIVLSIERGYLAMFKQILTGLENINTDIVFLVEHDVLYTKEHFEFTPLRKDLFYYNMNNWQVRLEDGFAVYWDCKKVSQLCAYKELLLEHYTERVRRVELEGYTFRMGFEPGTHRRHERVDNRKSEVWKSESPNLDIRHGKNLVRTKWYPSEFRNPCNNWMASTILELPGWGDFKS